MMQPTWGSGLMANADKNFGTSTDSKVKIVRSSSTQTFSYNSLSGASAYNLTQIQALFATKPDIVVTGFDLDVNDKASTSQIMLNYLNNGGVIILILERQVMANSFFSLLHPGLTLTPNFTGTSRFQLGNNNDEILNGPFGDLRGLYWGNDTAGAIGIQGLPESEYTIYSRDASGYPNIFKHNNLNLFFIGEGGFLANLAAGTGSTAGTTSTTSYPFAIDTDYTPITRTNWSGGDVENSRLFANVMGWAVKQAQLNGINTK